MRHAVEAVEAAGGHAVPGDGPYPCNWSKYGSLQNRDTNIGQVHVADRSGVTDEYTFIQEDDSTLTVGLSFDPSTNYSAGGSITLTDSLGSTGKKTWGKVRSSTFRPSCIISVIRIMVLLAARPRLTRSGQITPQVT
jgi:hypothetical protein